MSFGQLEVAWKLGLLEVALCESWMFGWAQSKSPGSVETRDVDGLASGDPLTDLNLRRNACAMTAAGSS
jgi:hypothetical protein